MKQTLRSFWARHKLQIISASVVTVAVLVVFVVVSNVVILSYRSYILQSNTTKHVRIGIVLGAGITKQGKPYKELQARLDVAAHALQARQVDKLILSGDNRFKNYDEPKAMQDYLVQVKHISASRLQPDYAGRSTYESCERASKVFGVKQAIIFSAQSHLPRAIYLCRHFGVEAYGISSGVEANNAQRREIEARVKALLNVYVRGEPTVLGPPIRF